MSKIISIVPRPLKWLVGHCEEERIREPFGTEMRTVLVQCVPNDAPLPFTEGGNSAIVTLTCGHTLEWERPYSAYFSPLEAWVHDLQNRVHRVSCHQCSELCEMQEQSRVG